MWWSLIVFGICSLHWTTGAEVQRGSYNLKISAISGHSKSLVTARCVPKSMNTSPICALATILDMSNLGLTNILFNALNDLIYVETLDLSNNNLHKLPRKIFSPMKNLRTLSLANNGISWLNMNLTGLNKLQRLDLTNNHIKIIKSRNLLDIPKSVEIILEGNHLYLLRIKQDQMHSIPIHSEVFASKDKSVTSNANSVPQELRSSRMSQWNYHDADLHRGVLCKNEHGVVHSVELGRVTKNRYSDCSSMFIYMGSHSLYLNYLGISGFKRNWYRNEDTQIFAIHLMKNRIYSITPELLNDLPTFISHISLTGNSIKVIRKHVIENKFINSLWLNDNSIRIIEDYAFMNTNLRELDLSQNYLMNMNFVRTLPTSIKILRLGDNLIGSIPEDSLVNLKYLEAISLKTNRLTHLSAGTFRGLNNLQNISLAFNQLKKIESGTFHLKNLERLDLADNKIVDISDGAFKDLKKILEVNLSFNKIKKISRDTFLGIKKSIISRINLDLNEIDAIEEGSFADMTIRVLRLNHNKISANSIAKGAFNSCKLANLHLDRNLFTEINGDSFYGIQVYNTISFLHNEIGTIRKGDATYMGCPSSIMFNLNNVKRIENGAFYESTKCQHMAIRFDEVKSIQAGIFDEANEPQEMRRPKDWSVYRV